MLKHWRSLFGYQSIVCCSWTAMATLIQVWSSAVYVLHVRTPCNHLSLKSRHLLRWLSQSIWKYCSEDLQISLCFSLSNVFPLISSWTFWTSKHHFFSSCFSSCQSLFVWGYKSLTICLGSGYGEDTCTLSCLTHSYKKVIIVGPFRYLKNLPGSKTFTFYSGLRCRGNLDGDVCINYGEE